MRIPEVVPTVTTEKQPREKHPRRFRSFVRLIPFKRVLAVFSIVCTVLYIACWVGEVVKATREKMERSRPHEEVPQKPLADRIKENVQRQIEEIRRVDARDLGFTFVYDLKMWNCNWTFHCVPSKVAVQYSLDELWAGPREPYVFSQYNGSSILGDRSAAQSPRTQGAPGLALVPGGVNQKPADRWNAYTNSIKPQHTQPIFGFPDPTLAHQQDKASAAAPTASKPKTLNSPDRESKALQEYLELTPPAPPTPTAKQPQATPAGQSDPASELSKALPLMETRNPANDEPPTPDEFSFAFNSAEPKLLVKGPIPTLHTLLGIPRATFVTIRAILKAGPWAITIFLACGILYFGVGAPLITILLRDRGKKDWDALPLTVIVLLFVSPIAVPILVGGVQSAAAALGNAVSWMVGLLAIVATWSAAIGVLVGIPHVWKSPREVKEALQVIRHGVEAIEKK
jgi:hypothetical protein